MRTNGTWYNKSNSRPDRKDAHRFRRYTTPACKNCELRTRCTKNVNGRFIDRSEYQDVVDANNQRVNKNPDYYRQRQQITEHQFGTIKRHMGYTHTNIRGKPKVMGEIGLMFTVYNLVRCVRILGVENFAKALKQRLCVKINPKYGSIWIDLRNFLFLPLKNSTGMKSAAKPLFELTRLFCEPVLDLRGG